MRVRGREAAAAGGYRTKNKNPTRQCGEKTSLKASQVKSHEIETA